MATFLLQKFQHPVAANSRQACALLAPFDVITVQADTWVWGDLELTNPWFRLLRWAAVSVADAQALLSTLPIQLDNNGAPMTFRRARANSLNLAHPAIPSALKSWWQDNTRATPMFTVPPGFAAVSFADLIQARAAVADPDYGGTGTPAAVTS